MNTTIHTLKEKWNQLKAAQPHLRIRNAADALGVSEGELLSTNVGECVTVLKPDFAGILSQVESLGKVMALTRNDECVHERKGVYLNGDFSSPHAQLFVGDDIDLRIFLSEWKFAFSVNEGDKKSIQFFGKDGMAIHKIYLTKDSNPDAFDALVEKFKSDEQNPGMETETIPPKADEKPDAEIDAAGFQQAWRDLKDTHAFFGMLRNFGLNRLQALRLAPDSNFAKQINNDKVVTLLEQAAAREFPIMVFVGNRGNIQIHTGNIKKVMWHGNWINVMDPNFNLHLDTTKIAQTWVVRKPTEDGMVTAVEVFNEAGEIIVQFFGKRKPGIPELEEWRTLVAELEN
ncbi:MAG: ChuX/HutX family heme-like substrate-binding protein [Moheibacter sp.]